VVAVDDVVVPVALALFQRAVLELEAPEPAAALLWVLGERELAGVVVPGAEEMHGFAVGGCAEREVELDCCHFCGWWVIFWFSEMVFLLWIDGRSINYDLLFPFLFLVCFLFRIP